jgi:hypothetical protein
MTNWLTTHLESLDDFLMPDVVFSITAGRWSCCGDDCVRPTGQTFRAPSPQALLEQSLVDLTSIAPAVSRPDAGSSPWQESTSLSTGAAVGIGAGGATGGIAILVAVTIWILYGRRKKRYPDPSTTTESGQSYFGLGRNLTAGVTTAASSPGRPELKIELPGQTQSGELPSNPYQRCSELSAFS